MPVGVPHEGFIIAFDFQISYLLRRMDHGDFGFRTE